MTNEVYAYRKRLCVTKEEEVQLVLFMKKYAYAVSNYWDGEWNEVFKTTYPLLANLGVNDILLAIYSGWVIGERDAEAPNLTMISFTLKEAVTLEVCRANEDSIESIWQEGNLLGRSIFAIERALNHGYEVKAAKAGRTHVLENEGDEATMKQRPIITHDQANALEQLRAKHEDVDLAAAKISADSTLPIDTNLAELTDDEFVRALYNGYLVLPFELTGTKPLLSKDKAIAVDEFIEYGAGMRLTSITFNYNGASKTVGMHDVQLINFIAAVSSGYVTNSGR